MGQAKQRGSLSDRIAQAQKQDIGSVSMTDPTDTLTGFQQAFLDGLIRPKRCDLDRDLFVVQDEPAGVHRLTYVRFDKLRVTALGVFVAVEPIKGVACFQLGYAVPPEYRGHGYASDLVLSALAEMHNGLGRNGVEKFCIEAVVGEENAVSRRVAEKIGFGTPKEIIDELSGKSALQYVLQVTV